ncbi:53759023-fa94-40bb-820c-3c7930057011 [Thermothielavioides terrestris]|uniref:53759023-fa94-40bb-820c-3c7930057011 n=1 Tax=Thermothielavioides terrestris TaxID=2587410 RepID=A0A3S4F5L6_9PEZI|nr:53759023-fa94-40bb-820c-3c7930057011 [Thermothielavioides terrestris]
MAARGSKGPCFARQHRKGSASGADAEPMLCIN